MAAYTKLADNEMNYYQFKAKQILLQKKEEKEWKDFCKQNAPDCAACLVSEKVEINESKDIGIQTSFQKPILRTDKTSLQPKYQKELPEALLNITTRLEKIDVVLSKLFVENEKKQVLPEKKSAVQERNPMTLPPVFLSQQIVRSFEEQRKLQIQNALKQSLQNSGMAVRKKPLAAKPRNSSFFLPHDLEVKRAAARKAYLASLETVPKVSFLKKRQSSNEKAKSSQSKKNVSTRKKILSVKENPKSKDNGEETLVEAVVADNAEDENIEGVVEAIFDDLLGEAALDLNKIRQKKREQHGHIESETLNRVKKTSVLNNPSTCDDSKFVANNSNTGIMRLKLFIDSSEDIQGKNNLRKEQIEVADKSTSPLIIEDPKPVPDKRAIVTLNFERRQDVPKTAPKFECGVSCIIQIDPIRAKDIASKKDRFWQYLENISETAKGNFNPWALNRTLAESILDDCINDVAKELSELPSNIVQDLYNQEFVQHVEM